MTALETWGGFSPDLLPSRSSVSMPCGFAPIYPSPMADFGYDVADYCGIDPIFGSSFRTLIDCSRGRTWTGGSKIILDFVPNHTFE